MGRFLDRVDNEYKLCVMRKLKRCVLGIMREDIAGAVEEWKESDGNAYFMQNNVHNNITGN